MINTPDLDQERADPAAILAVLMKTDRPLSIAAIADHAHSDAMPAARTLGDLVRSGDVKRLMHGKGGFYWLETRQLPADWSRLFAAPSNARTVALMSQHDEPEDADKPAAAIPAKAAIKHAKSATEATMQKIENAKTKPLSPALAEVLAQLAKNPLGIKPRELGRLMSLDSSVISQRLAKLKAAGYAKPIGGGSWHATNTSTGAPLEAKMPETPHQHAGLNIDNTAKKPKSTTATKLREAGPAIIDGINTRSLLERASDHTNDDANNPNERIAITDLNELVIMEGNSTLIIHKHTARRIAALFRTLDKAHPLAVAA